MTIPTCEENEDVLYANEHTRLYRFVKPVLIPSGESPNSSTCSQDGNGEWKERGTGELKLLRNRINSRCRVVMRREKTLKVCANHHVTAEMHLDRLPGKLSAQTCLWFTPADFADGESHPERFCLRFRTADGKLIVFSRFLSENLAVELVNLSSDLLVWCSAEANEFRQAFERAKSTPQGSEQSATSETRTTADDAAQANKSSDAESSKPKEDKHSEELADRLGTLTVASETAK